MILLLSLLALGDFMGQSHEIFLTPISKVFPNILHLHGTLTYSQNSFPRGLNFKLRL